MPKKKRKLSKKQHAALKKGRSHPNVKALQDRMTSGRKKKSY